MIKCAFLSDLHGYLPEDVKQCEIVFICGDISPLNIQRDYEEMRYWLSHDFKEWAEELPCDKVVFIAGNHDLYMESNGNYVKELFLNDNKVTYLFHENYIYTGRDGKEYSIFGSPYCKVFGTWAFMRNNEILTELFSEIPENLDILITHDAPYGCSDICLEQMWWNSGEHIGNIPLREAIVKTEPKIHVSGHLHSASHEWVMLGETQHINCSIKNEQYNPVYDIIYKNYDKESNI